MTNLALMLLLAWMILFPRGFVLTMLLILVICFRLALLVLGLFLLGAAGIFLLGLIGVL